MTDFAERHRGVPYFGIWADETADIFGGRDAMAILADAVERCQEQDMRHSRDVADALAYLDEHGGRLPAVAAFRKALDELHPITRRRLIHDAYKRLSASLLARVDVSA